MSISKKIRFYWWYFEALFQKRKLFIFLGFLLSMFIWPFFFAVGNLMLQAKKPLKIGLVGNYTTANLPPEVLTKIGRGLTKIADNGVVEPDLAESIKIKNSGKIYEIKLKKNLRFNDQTPFTAKSVNYKFQDVTYVVKNDEEAYFVLKSPYSPFLSLLSFPILNKNLQGAGDWRLVRIDWQDNFIKTIELAGKQKIIYRFYPNESVALTAFSLGEVNRLENLSSVNLSKIWKKVKIEKMTDWQSFVAIFINFKGGILSEKNIRQALNYSLDRRIFKEKLTYSSFSPKTVYYSDNVKKYYYDPLYARTLIQKMSLKSNDKINFTLYTLPIYKEYAAQIANNWNTKLGSKIKVKETSGIPYQWQAYLAVQKIPIDPDQYLLWHSNKTFHFSNYRNLKIDKILEDGRQEIDMEKRKEIYFDLQKTLSEDLPAIFLFHPDKYSIYY